MTRNTSCGDDPSSFLTTEDTHGFYARPETIESLFIAFRLTGDERFREYGWNIFQSIETHCRLETGGYAGIQNVDDIPVTNMDRMETFFLVRLPANSARQAGSSLTVE